MLQHGIYLSWEGVSAEVKNKKILENINGFCNPGSMLAIMGPSGAGKTTLLSILARNYGPSLRVSGKVLANNTQYDQNQFYNFASFVYQNDILNQALTVRQTLQFIAKLKLADKVKAQQRADQLIKDFGLQKCQDTYVGGKVIKGISGGEKKRVCIAAQMIGKPDLLILDQPTSGLDSYMANNIIKIFKKLANKEGKTIIFTIHQPSYKIFTQLDRLLLLDKGSCIYQGVASGILQYMLSLKIKISPKSTVCDYFMFEISQYKSRTENNYKTTLNSLNYQQKLAPIIKKQQQQASQVAPDGYKIAQVANTFFNQSKILFGRELKLFLRNPMKMGRSIGNALLMTFILGIIFIHAVSDYRPIPDQTYIKFELIYDFIIAQSTSFIIATSVIMSGIFSVALVFPVERQVYSKQIASKSYNTLPYFITKLIVEVFTLIFSVIVFASGVYWLTGYSATFVQFVKFTIVISSVALVGNSIGFWTGSLFKDAQRSTAMSPALLMPLMMFSGLYNKLDSIPAWIGWLQYISPFRFGLHALLLNQFGDEKYWAVDIQAGIRYQFDYKQDLSIDLSYWANVGILIGLAGFYYVLAFIFLKNLSSKISA